MKNKLKTLEEDNTESRIRMTANGRPQLNGVACPECNKELYDSNPLVTLCSYPAQKKTACMGYDGCGYVGYRIV